MSRRFTPRLSPRHLGRATRRLTLTALGVAGLLPSTALAGSGATLTAQVKQATGYSASQLENKPACAAAAPGQISCRADILALKSTGQPVSLRSPPQATPQTFVPGHGRKPARPGAIRPASSGVQAPAAYTPAYLQWAYDLTWLSSNNGTGDTVAVVDAYDDPNAEADLSQFRQEYGLWPCAATATALACLQAMNTSGAGGGQILKQYNQSGQEISQSAQGSHPSGSGNAPVADVTGGWEVEESLDVDAVSSICPHCTIDLVESSPGPCDPSFGQCTYPNFDTNLATATASADSLSPQQISMSFGVADYEGCDTGTWWFTGVSSLAASGDYGYQGTSTNLGYCNENQQLPTVSYPAAYSQVTAIGGTSLAQANNPRGFAESVWNDGYIPGPGPDPSQSGYYQATESGCDTSQPVPAYQTGVTTACPGRAYNDISADADPASGLAVYDSFGGDQNDAYGCDTVIDPSSCIVGGTSLATPLTSAYEALAGITPADSPAWAYGDASSTLNDITSGSDEGSPCLSSQVVICNASAGWDGPTGNGSINGALENGAPGIGGDYATLVTPDGSVAGTYTASLQGGIYLNNQVITDAFPPAPATPSAGIQWEYGPTTSYGSTVLIPGQPTGSAPGTVSATLTGLSPCTVYHFRLDANNVDATAYGYDNTLLTVDPTVAGTPTQGQALTAALGVPDPASCNVTYQWERANSTGTFTAITGATSPTYVPTGADVGHNLELVVTGTDSANPPATATATSAAIGPIAAPSPPPPPPTTTSTTPTTTTTTPTTTVTTTSTTPATPQQPTVVKAPTITSGSQVGSAIEVSGGSYTNSTGTRIQFLRCAHTCKLLSTGGASHYKTVAADAGHFIEVKLTVYGAAGTTSLSSTNWVGPIVNASAGVQSVTTGAKIASAVIRVDGTTGLALATVRVTSATVKTVKLTISRATQAPTSAWVCVVTGSTLDACTVARALKGTESLSLAIKRGQSLKVVAVRAGAVPRGG